MITYSILADQCTDCGLCLRHCPSQAISGAKKKPHSIDPGLCIRCGICLSICKFEAVKVE